MSGRKRQQPVEAAGGEEGGTPAPPKKRGRQPKSTTPAAAAAAYSFSREEWEATDERLLAITKAIMFAAGDSNEPSESNARMLLGLMQAQLRRMAEYAIDRARENGREAITLRDLLMRAARHKLVLGRMLNHAKALNLVHSLSRVTRDEEEEGEEEKEEDGVPTEADILVDDVDEEEEGSEEKPGSLSLRSARSATYTQLEAAIDSLQAGFRAADLTDPSFEDLTRVARDRRMASRVSRLREDVYKQFHEARQATYVSRVRVKRYGGIPEGALFVAWLGLPPVDAVLTYALSWLAKEIVTQVVDDAYMCLLMENKAGLNRAKRGAAASRLAPRHYEEALRKNLGWRSQGDVLFGYIAPSE